MSNCITQEFMQPKHDLEIVEGATLDDLDPDLVAAVLRRQRQIHPRVFGRLPDQDALAALNITRTTEPDGKPGITLAGLLALGTYPQHFFPRLTVTFACYPGTSKASPGGIKYADSQSMAGPIPAILVDTVAAVRRNMRVGGMLVNGLRVDVPDYPLDAVREAVCNALMHRDYSPMGRGSQVQVNLYADRLEILSPGGLYGAVTVDMLGTVGASSTRNQHLSELLESTPYEEGGFVAENRGTGFNLIDSELANAGMPAAEVVDRPALFSLTLRKRGESKAEREDATEHEDEAVACGAAGGVANGAAGSVASGVANGAASALSGSASKVLDALAQLGKGRTSDIARTADISRSTAAYALKKLVGLHLVETDDDSKAKNSPNRVYRLAVGA